MAEGRWHKEGRTGSDPEAPGSYGGWVKQRRTPGKSPRTAQQMKIGVAGREVGEVCKGKTGGAFKTCRHEVMAKHFK